ncbi:hypothetical protein B0I00_2167 [Novosphingobium kunmingense]|uniref:DUF1134 domain-containing protein n=1 Tax=Novosphingobium kunmingense TaxID=1211806 RepID=A0A2N0H6J7_9SPHN|nr:DUF1134 domain-containing protein [Novosphingobium kunmingense]PKB14571.1 hypothetical protein B0I00_2167 [Novosphingobium kunmingense]
MTRHFAATLRRALTGLIGAAAVAAMPVAAQVQSVDPDKAIDGDLAKPATSAAAPAPATPQPAVASADGTPVTETGGAEQAAATASVDPTAAAAKGDTYKEDDLIGAAEGVFGKGAKGLADIIKGLLKKQGEPNGYIVGREGGAALGVGVRYGSGTLFHKVEGKRPVYWTGPSIGFDAGANAGNTFVLVYNLHNSQDLYKRYPAGEGQAYLVGGFNASYMRRDDVVLIPVRMGVGLRLGINAGYMKFSEKQRWLPF